MIAAPWPAPSRGALAGTTAGVARATGLQHPAASWPRPLARVAASLADEQAAAAPPPEPRAPALAFDEDELARAAAGAAVEAARSARARAAAAAQERQAAALERLAGLLEGAARAHADQEQVQRGQVLALARAIARALTGHTARGAEGMLEVVGGILDQVPETGGVRLLADPGAAEALKPHLPALASRAGLAGTVELVVEPGLRPGTVQVLWAGGWSELVPERIERLIAEALSAHEGLVPEIAIPAHGGAA